MFIKEGRYNIATTHINKPGIFKGHGSRIAMQANAPTTSTGPDNTFRIPPKVSIFPGSNLLSTNEIM